MKLSKIRLLQTEIFLSTEARLLAREAINYSHCARNECLFTKGVGVLMAIEEAKNCLAKHGVFSPSIIAEAIEDALRVAKDDGQTPVVAKYIDLKKRFRSFEATADKVAVGNS